MFGISLNWWQAKKPGKILIQGLADSPEGEDMSWPTELPRQGENGWAPRVSQEQILNRLALTNEPFTI